MKFLPVSLALLSLLLAAEGQGRGDAGDNPAKWNVELPESVADGTPAQPDAKPAPIRFKVIASQTKRVDVVVAPELDGLPPVVGTVDVTVQMVEEPELPDPPMPLPTLPPNDPAVVARMAELREKYQSTTLVFISASVYDHKRTLLRIYTNGDDGSEVVAWSNLNLNHFSGFSIYRVKDAVDGSLYDYGILMGLGNENTTTLSEIDSRSDMKYEAPKIPKLPDLAEGGPAFVVMEGIPGTSAMHTLEQIHDLYRKEGKRMEAAFYAREKAVFQRRAYLLANPPKPQDVTISFWKRDSRTAASPEKPSTELSR